MSTQQLETAIVLDLVGNLERKARQYERSLNRLGRYGSKHVRKLGKEVNKTSSLFDKMGRRIAAVAAGAASLKTAGDLLDIKARYERLGITGGIDGKEVDALKRRIYSTSSRSDIRVDANEVLSAIEEIVERTGDLKFAENNILNVARAIQATGAAGSDIGGIMAELQKLGITSAQEVMAILDMLAKQGEEGAFTLKQLAALGPRVFAAYSATGRMGPEAIREMGAMLQMIRMGTGSSEQAATAFEALLRNLTDPSKIQKLKELGGINLFDPEALARGEKVLRPINEIMEELIRKTNGDITKLGMIFDAEAMRAFNAMIAEYKRTGNMEKINAFMNVSADGKLATDAERMANTGSSRVMNAKQQVFQGLDNMTDPASFNQGLMGGSGNSSTSPAFPTFGGGNATVKIEVESRNSDVKVNSVDSNGMNVETQVPAGSN